MMLPSSHLPVAWTDSLASGAKPGKAARRRLPWIWVCLLLAIAQVLIAGYAVGVGNQVVQVPLLQRMLDARLYARDVMISSTAADYPTFFFQLMATPARLLGIEQLYFCLHVLSCFGVMLAITSLSFAIFNSRAAGLLAGVMLVAGHHHALAGDTLYSTGFTHTFAVFPMAIAATALMCRRRYAMAFGLAGVIFNLHALTAAYLVALLAAGWLGNEGRSGARAHWPRLAVALLLFGAVASPTLRIMIAHRQAFDARWIGLTHVRSADHSFPSSWWQAGSADVPRFMLLVGLFALSLSFASKPRQHRQMLAMAAATGAMFFIGFVFSDLWPAPIVLRAQLFRSSRLAIVLFFVQIAYAAAQALRMPWRERGPNEAVQNRQPRWRSWLECVSAVFTVLVLAIPAMLPLLQVAFAAAVVVAIINARMSVIQSVFVAFTIFTCIAGRHDLGFPLVAGVGGFDLTTPAVRGGLFILGLAGLILLLAWFGAAAWLRWMVHLGVLCAAVFLLVRGGQPAQFDPWIATQVWVRDHTPIHSVFLTPIQPGGFRLHSQRAVVGEWRDGTQLYFSAAFAPIWWSRMSDLQPGLLTDASGRQLLSPGRSLESLDDDSLVALARKYRATHIVLPAGSDRRLPVCYGNDGYTVYLPIAREEAAPSDVPDKERWQADERFMRDTVLPNIEKYRKSNVRLQLVDEKGHPLAGAAVDVRQVRQAFDFSASLPFFGEPAVRPTFGDYKPPPVQQQELAKFTQIFNYSMIPFSSKWMYIEPVEGQLHYEELDRYIDWCTQHDIGIEYHFISGYSAAWLQKKNPQQQGEAFLRHARELAQRYGNKIDAWQVTNEGILFQHSPAVFKELRSIVPNAKLGLADCAKFGPENRSANTPALRERDMYRGLDQIRWLKQQGVKVDFFGIHGHRPFGLWPEAHVMYDVLDKFAGEGVRLHITEVTVPEDAPVLGVIHGGKFTPDVQAEYYQRFLTICFSHPSVDMINLWGIGPNTWQRGSGLLDKNYNPKPAFFALKKLITETWRTNVNITLGLDGSASFRGFQGDYEATVRLMSGATARVTFSVPANSADRSYRLQVIFPKDVNTQ